MPNSPAPVARSIPRDQHSISRKQISHNALRVLYRLNDAGFEAYLVGGAVRDLLIGVQPKDFDVATSATPEQVKALFRNCRLIGRRFRLAHIVYGPEIIEVATFRAADADDDDDRSSENGRILRDNVYGTLEEDAVRRDFTANALYYGVQDFAVRDFTGGFDDTLARRLRLIGDPETRYREDPVRMLRAVRLAAKLDFGIDTATAAPIPGLAGLLHTASNARLFDESQKLFLAGHAQASLLGMERLGLLDAVFPDLARALRADASGQCRRMLLNAMATTDQRVAEGLPVTPAYLFAAMLWPAYAASMHALQAEGHPTAVAEQRAADRVILRQCKHVAIPRRFSQVMEEIWFLQSRLATRQRKRVLRLLAHPRFRAAYDFLLLRASVVSPLAKEAEFWAQAQSENLDAVLDREAATAEAESPARRRRRRPRRKGAAPAGE